MDNDLIVFLAFLGFVLICAAAALRLLGAF